MLFRKWLVIILCFFVLLFPIVITFSKDARYYNEEAHFSLSIPHNFIELTPRYSARLDDRLLNRNLLPSQVYRDKVRDYDVAFLAFDDLDTIEKRKTILGIKIERYEYFIYYRKLLAGFFVDEDEVEKFRCLMKAEIRARGAQDIRERDMVIDKEQFCYCFGLGYTIIDGTRVESFWGGFLSKMHGVFLRLEILNPLEDLDCSVLFADLVRSFSFDDIYRFSKVYAVIRALAGSLLIVILVVGMFCVIPRVVSAIQRIYLRREREAPGRAREPLPVMGAGPKPDAKEAFDVTVHVRVSEFFPSKITSETEVKKSLDKLRQSLLEQIKKNRKIVPY